MFTTYVGEGRNIGATPDGRQEYSPISDSCGPMQGTDRKGISAMLNSVANLGHDKAIGTMVLNLRISKSMLNNSDLRNNFIGTIRSYFAMGGSQIQVSVLDSEILNDAIAHPEKHENLSIRIGGYTEYFNRLDMKMRLELAKRTEYSVL